LFKATGVPLKHIGGLLIESEKGALNDKDITYINSLLTLVCLDISKNIEVGDVGDFFLKDHKELEDVTIPATSFGDDAFYGCEQLKSANLPLATSLGNNAFYDCKDLGCNSYNKSVYIPSLISLGDNAFYGCKNYLKNIYFPKLRAFGDNAFQYCIELEDANLPELISFGDNAFNHCSSLNNIDLPIADRFGDNAFKDCKMLGFYADNPTICIPKARIFGDNAFTGCKSIYEIDLPEVEKFGDNAFQNCVSLKTVNVPNLTNIGDNAFSGCTKKIVLKLGSKVPTVGNTTFSNYDPETKASMIRVTSEQMSAYDTEGDGYWHEWKIQGTYTVDFNANGGSSVESQIIANGNSISEPDCPTKKRIYIWWLV
jgi:hypothetical protein